MTAQNKTTQKGFTLIELLVVIGILAVLLAITLIAINPARQFGQANDTKRRSDVTQILNAVGQYSASNAGNLPTGLTSSSSAAISSTGIPTLCAQLVPNYLPALPADPSLNDQAGIDATECGSGGWITNYTISVDSNNRITVSAPDAYAGPIEVTR